ncbi:aspartate aminotransferase family protein [Streptomyces halobius]|uniref:Aminotransferase class III-fold pyridoxal phosphate-dependent enzyme n=1 Tax=Streptomyces halobius TaxID=2879846 RepID=A0ABY4M169_9ACTN|nr:aminotransferase class III-fold pyridoxal phosphate-dependent enzyme [Streptomyces halobius]UQA90614.1 aminotransferase class III-fold pyridoxal phosphate-dependent enzyme [Streptomyces halobius]
MRSSIGSPEFADSFMIETLNEFGLAVRYVRAEGNTLYHVAEDGTEVGVFDAAGGFGSLMFGHHHPQIVAHAKWLLDQQTPVHTQLAGYTFALNLAAELNTVVRRELETEDRFFAHFGNTGAEAVEIAVKHAELERGMRIAGLRDEIAGHVEQARRAVARGAALSEAAAAFAHGGGFEDLVAEVTRRNAVTGQRPPLLLALEGGFHGKLIGSVQLTYNEAFRAPFKALAAQTRFIPRDRPELIAKVVEEERATLWDVVVRDGVVEVAERDFPVFTAFVVEPIMGERGIVPLSARLARALREACDTIGVPLVADEIQCGMGRSGTFLAGTQIGLRPDYIVLAKALGGGIAKLGVVLINEHRYQKEFEMMHTSTFGRDGFSSLVAVKVVQMLEAEDGKAYQLAAERGAKARAMMEAIKADYPDVVKDVRGKGLMLGFEIHKQSGSASPEIREATEHEALSYIIGGHLLRKHRVRIFSTASSDETLRFEPSIYLSDEEIAQVDVAFRDVCQILQDQDASRFA